VAGLQDSGAPELPGHEAPGVLTQDGELLGGRTGDPAVAAERGPVGPNNGSDQGPGGACGDREDPGSQVGVDDIVPGRVALVRAELAGHGLAGVEAAVVGDQQDAPAHLVCEAGAAEVLLERGDGLFGRRPCGRGERVVEILPGGRGEACLGDRGRY